jgi:hypothetical protein
VAFGHWLYYRFIVLSIVVSIGFRNSPEIHLEIKIFYGCERKGSLFFYSIIILLLPLLLPYQQQRELLVPNTNSRVARYERGAAEPELPDTIL